MVKKKHKIHTKQSETYPGSDICSDHNIAVMKYNLQRKKRIYKPALNSTKWTVSKLKEEREIENYNNRIKKILTIQRQRQHIQINNGRT